MKKRIRDPEKMKAYWIAWREKNPERSREISRKACRNQNIFSPSK